MSWLDKAEAEDPAYNGTGWGLGSAREEHHHSWRLVREVRQHGFLFQFFICTQPGCPAPDKSEVSAL